LTPKGYLEAPKEFMGETRQDWLFGVDMAIYHSAGDNPRTPVVSDGFLSLNVGLDSSRDRLTR
jgi:hypothetical protein